MCQGTLFTRPVGGSRDGAGERGEAGNASGSKTKTGAADGTWGERRKRNGTSAEQAAAGDANEGAWNEGYRASFKVVAQNKTFVLRIDPVLMLEQNRQKPSPRPSPRAGPIEISSGAGPIEAAAASVQLPVAVALDFELTDAGRLGLPERFRGHSGLFEEAPEAFGPALTLPRPYAAALAFSDLGFQQGAVLDPDCDAILVEDDLKPQAPGGGGSGGGKLPILRFAGEIIISYRCFAGFRECFWDPLKSPCEISPVRLHFGYFSPPDRRRRAPERA